MCWLSVCVLVYVGPCLLTGWGGRGQAALFSGVHWHPSNKHRRMQLSEIPDMPKHFWKERIFHGHAQELQAHILHNSIKGKKITKLRLIHVGVSRRCLVATISEKLVSNTTLHKDGEVITTRLGHACRLYQREYVWSLCTTLEVHDAQLLLFTWTKTHYTPWFVSMISRGFYWVQTVPSTFFSRYLHNQHDTVQIEHVQQDYILYLK